MRRRRYSYSRRNSTLMPTLLILVVALVAALGGAVYWDKVQEEQEKEQALLQQQMLLEEEEIRLPTPANEEVSLVEEPAEETPAEAPEKTEESEETTPPAEEEPVKVEANVPESAEADESYFADAAFVGDSLTQGLQLYDILDTEVIANRGINLESIYNPDKIRVAEGYTSVFNELERIQPKKIYVQLGMNDIAWRTEKDFSRLYGELIDKIHSDFPESILYVQSIFPVTGWYAEKDNGIDNEKVVAYNKLLLDLANEKGCYYLDVHSALVNENGVLPDDMSPDGIHLNAPHYQKWFHYLKTHTVQ